MSYLLLLFAFLHREFFREYQNVAKFATILLRKLENAAKFKNATNFKPLRILKCHQCRECAVLFQLLSCVLLLVSYFYHIYFYIFELLLFPYPFCWAACVCYIVCMGVVTSFSVKGRGLLYSHYPASYLTTFMLIRTNVSACCVYYFH